MAGVLVRSCANISTVTKVACAAALAALALVEDASAQWIGKQTGCITDSISANPNRPTISNSSDVTQYGVLEVEYGWDHTWPEANVQQNSVGGLLKFGMLCDIELRWNTTSFLSQTQGRMTQHTIGDNWLGSEIRFHKQTGYVPTFAFSYSAKIPSATVASGLGSGSVDHSFTFGVSDLIQGLNLDFNVTEFALGRPDAGFLTNQQFALAASHRLWRKWQIVGEFYGQTQTSHTTRGFASSLWAVTYKITPRLVVDGGIEFGLTSGGPHRHIFFGATYSIANLYHRKH